MGCSRFYAPPCRVRREIQSEFSQSDSRESDAERKQIRINGAEMFSVVVTEVRRKCGRRRRHRVVVVPVMIAVDVALLVASRRRVVAADAQPRRKSLQVHSTRTSRQFQIRSGHDAAARRRAIPVVGCLAQARPLSDWRRSGRCHRTAPGNAADIAADCYSDAVALTTVAIAIGVGSCACAVFRNRS